MGKGPDRRVQAAGQHPGVEGAHLGVVLGDAVGGVP